MAPTELRVSLCSASVMARASSINWEASCSVKKFSSANKRGLSVRVVKVICKAGK